MQLIGIKQVDYVSKKTGKPVRGCNLYLTDAMQDSADTKGIMCESEFLSETVMSPPWSLVGKQVLLVYNKYGSVIDVTPREGGK